MFFPSLIKISHIVSITFYFNNILSTLASEMSEPNIRNRIIGGESVRPHAMPWQAAVVMKGKSRPNCGATIICPQFVIGAAHCRAKYIDRPHLLEILIGAHSWPVESTTTRKNIKKIHKYRRPYNNAARSTSSADKNSFSTSFYFIFKK